jgi:rhodanese-related sulfurtransferase
MKKLIFIYLLLTLSMLAACQNSASQTSPSSDSSSNIDWSQAGPDAQKNQLSFADVKADVEKGAKFYDVRSEDEFNAGNFGITDSLPIAELEAGILPDLPKDTAIYVHCLRGIRSARAVAILREAGFSQVYDLGGVQQVEAIGGVIK